MSSKSSKGPKKAPPTPRAIDDIRREYASLNQQAGDAQYQIFILNESLKELNSNLRALSQEGASRMALDAAAKAEQEAEVKNEHA